MVDFAVGFALGALIVAIVWKMMATHKTFVIRIKDTETDTSVIEEEIIAVKPDNAKARHYSTPEYRAEMAYVKEQNKNKHAGIS